MAPLVFFTPGGMGPIATTVDRKLLSSLVAEKHGSSYRLHPLQLRPLQLRPLQLRPLQLRPLQLRPLQLRPLQLRPLQLRPLQLRPLQLRPLQLRPLQLRPLQVEFLTVVTCNCVYLRLEVVITIDQLASLLEPLTCPASSRISVTLKSFMYSFMCLKCSFSEPSLPIKAFTKSHWHCDCAWWSIWSRVQT